MGEPSELRFDRAQYAADSPTAAPCAMCRAPLREQYWKWETRVVCEGCRAGLLQKVDKSLTADAFRRALLRGGAVALGCGVAYAIFVGVTHIQMALATIGIAIVVAREVRKASGGVSGRRFQVLAVALTYFASTMGYVPSIFEAIGKSATAKVEHRASAASDSSAPSPAPVEETHQSSGLNVVKAIALLVGIMLAAPFLEITEAPIGVLIVLFGLWRAWRMTAALPVRLEGPFQVALQTGPPAS